MSWSMIALESPRVLSLCQIGKNYSLCNRKSILTRILAGSSLVPIFVGLQRVSVATAPNRIVSLHQWQERPKVGQRYPWAPVSGISYKFTK